MRTLLWTTTFKKSFKRLARQHPEMKNGVLIALGMLASDPFDPRLRTHKLKGRLQGSWACKAGYDLRIIFEFVEEGILLLAVGTHEEVY
jgi:mRNA interferase YafQ